MSLTGKFNAQNIGFDDPVERIENSFDPNDHAFVIDFGQQNKLLDHINSPWWQVLLNLMHAHETEIATLETAPHTPENSAILEKMLDEVKNLEQDHHLQLMPEKFGSADLLSKDHYYKTMPDTGEYDDGPSFQKLAHQHGEHNALNADLSQDAQEMLRTLQKAETIENSREEINIYNPQDDKGRAPITGRTPEDILFENRFNAGQTGADTGHSGLNNKTAEARKIHEARHGGENQRKKVDKILESYNRMESFIRHLEDMAQFWEDKAREAEEKAAQLRAEIAKNVERMQENSAFIGEADKLLEDYKNGKAVDENAARNLLKKRGVEGVDDMSMAVLMQRLQDERDKADQENRDLDQDNDQLDQEATKEEDNAIDYKERAKGYRDQAIELKGKHDALKTQLDNGEITEEEFERDIEVEWDKIPAEEIAFVQKEYKKIIQSESELTNNQSSDNIEAEQFEGKLSMTDGFDLDELDYSSLDDVEHVTDRFNEAASSDQDTPVLVQDAFETDHAQTVKPMELKMSN